MIDRSYVPHIKCKKCGDAKEFKTVDIMWDGATGKAYLFPDFVPLVNAKLAGICKCEACGFTEECVLVVKDGLMDIMLDSMGETLMSYKTKKEYRELLTSALQEWQESERINMKLEGLAYALGYFILERDPSQKEAIVGVLETNGLMDYDNCANALKDMGVNFLSDFSGIELTSTDAEIAEAEEDFQKAVKEEFERSMRSIKPEDVITLNINSSKKSKKKKCGDNDCGGGCSGDCKE